MSEYEEIKRDILLFTNGRRLLSIADVKRYTGLVDYRTIKRRFNISGTTITAQALALALTKGA